MLVASVLLSKTCLEVAAEVEPLEKLGLVKTDLAQFSQLPRFAQHPQLEKTAVIALSRDLDTEGAIDELGEQVEQLDETTLYRAAVATQTEPLQLYEMLRPVVELGLIPADLGDPATLGSPNSRACKLLSLDLDGIPPWRTRLGALELASAAIQFRVAVGDLAPAVVDLEKCGVDVSEAQAFIDFCSQRERG